MLLSLGEAWNETTRRAVIGTSLPVFGLRTSNNNAKFAIWCSKSNGKVALNYGSYDSGFVGNETALSMIDVYNVGAKMYGNGTQLCDGGSPTLADDQRTIYLFVLNDNGSASLRDSHFKISRFKVSNALQERVDFISVRFTNELGQSEGAMYDKVSGQLFRNQGTGAFTIGPDKS